MPTTLLSLLSQVERLERERDEARASLVALGTLAKKAEQDVAAADAQRNRFWQRAEAAEQRIAELERERDEARAGADLLIARGVAEVNEQQQRIAALEAHVRALRFCLREGGFYSMKRHKQSLALVPDAPNGETPR